MRLLLDECIDERFRLLFPTHECQISDTYLFSLLSSCHREYLATLVYVL